MFDGAPYLNAISYDFRKRSESAINTQDPGLFCPQEVRRSFPFFSYWACNLGLFHPTVPRVLSCAVVVCRDTLLLLFAILKVNQRPYCMDSILFQPIPYDELNMASSNRRKGLSNSNLEVRTYYISWLGSNRLPCYLLLLICHHTFQKYLSNDEFVQYLGTSRDVFYRLPEFKRNDIKRKVM